MPDPALADRVRKPKLVVLPYSTYQLVDTPFGVTTPATVAEVGSIAVTGPDITVGGNAQERPTAAVTSTAKPPASATTTVMSNGRTVGQHTRNMAAFASYRPPEIVLLKPNSHNGRGTSSQWGDPIRGMGRTQSESQAY